MRDHLRAFARDLIKRENGSVAVSTITHVFTNLGNAVPGQSAEEHRQAVRACLREDAGLHHDEDSDCISLKDAD